MRSFAKPILIAIGIITFLLCLAVLVANIYLQSDDVKKRLQMSISQQLEMPAKIDQAYFTPWSGLTISGITLPSPDNSKVPFLAVPQVKVYIKLTSLFFGKLQVNEVIVQNPVLVSTQVSQKSISIPAASSIVNATASASAKNLPNALKAPATAVQKPTPVLPDISVKSLKIQNGRAFFYDAEKQLIAHFDKISLSARISSNDQMEGEFMASSSKVFDFFQLRNLKGKFTRDSTSIVATDIYSDWADGQVEGRVTLQKGVQPAFSTSLALRNVSVPKLAESCGFNSTGKRGALFGKLDILGTYGQPETFRGSAEAFLENGRLEPLEVIRQIGELFRIDELRMLDLREAKAAVTFQNNKVSVEKLVFASNNVVMDATGESGFDGALALNARFHVNERIRRESHGLIGANFQQSEESGFIFMPFKVTGTLAKPKTDLLDNLVGARVGQDVGGLLKSLFRSPPNTKKPSTPAPGQSN